MSLLGLGGDAGQEQLAQAMGILNGIQEPGASALSLPELQKYVQAGVLSPQQYQAILADPSTYQKVMQATQDNSGTSAQKAALQQLGGIVKAGGSNDINKANLLNNVNQTNQAMQASRQGIMENAQERGVSGGGLDFVSQLLNEQGNAANANSNAVNSAASNAQLALNAIAQQGALGGQLQGQSNQTSQAQAQAAQQIAQYNSQLQSQAAQYNTQNANDAQAANLANAQGVSNKNADLTNQRMQYNAQVPETMYQNDMQKAGAMVGVAGDQAKASQQQQTNQNAMTGSLAGAFGNAFAGYANRQSGAKNSDGSTSGAQLQGNGDASAGYGAAHGGEIPECYAEGGEVHDHRLCMKAGGQVPGQAKMPGDNTANDTVPAMLSPHEIVLPRSVAQAPNAPEKAAQFVQGVKGGGSTTPTVNSFAEALKVMEDNGLELRLHARG